MIYYLTIQETIHKVYEVEADSEQQVEDIWHDTWGEGEGISFLREDLQGVDWEIVDIKKQGDEK